MGWRRSLVNSWSKFRQFSPFERYLLVWSLFLLPLIALTIRLLGFSRARSLLARLARIDKSQRRSKIAKPTDQIAAAARMVQAAASHGLYHPSCLERSFVLWWLLHRSGIESELKIGVCKEADRIEAHAWVEHDGIAIMDNENAQERFLAFQLPVMPMNEKS